MPTSVARVMQWQWPREFPVAQFPNPPLIVALAAGGAARLTHGSAHAASRSVFYMGLTVWAYEEARRGTNWFRRALGVGALLYIASSIAGELPG
jgi:hypothetical protein